MMMESALEKAGHCFREGYREREQGKPFDPTRYDEGTFAGHDYKEGWNARDCEIYWFNKRHNMEKQNV